MTQPTYRFNIISISLCTFLSCSAWADEVRLGACYAHVPPLVEDDSGIPVEQQPITISARQARLEGTGRAHFEGGISISQGNRDLSAQQAEIDQQRQLLNASGGIVYSDGRMTFTSDTLSADLSSYQTELRQAQYQLHGQPGRGRADVIRLDRQQNLSLAGASYTACPPDDVSWQLNAGRIELDSSEEWAKAYDASVELFGVPVFYLPYFTFPVTSKRKSGVLFPSITSSSSNGLDVAVPYYWNLAPNYDFTLTPRLMTRRGTQLQGVFRYLGKQDQGQLNAEYLADDRLTESDRYLLHWDHNGNYRRHWRLQTDYTKVGDPDYFTELGSQVGTTTDSQLLQSGLLAYRTRYWDAEMELRNFQVLGEIESPYIMLPRLAFDVRYPTDWHHLRLGLGSEFSYFANDDDSVVTASRLHLEPSLSLPWSTPWSWLTTEARLYMTAYDQQIPTTPGDGYPAELLDSQVARILPSLRIDGGLTFDRHTRWFDQPYLQTLEPRAQYLYVPFEEQSNIGLYDTTNLQSDYYGLFRSRRFSGLDRISDANQVTLGVTSRFFNSQNEERLRLALGEIIYLESSRVSLLGDDAVIAGKTSALALEADANVAAQWYFHTGIQYDADQRKLERGNSALEYRPGPNTLYQLNYRYIHDDLLPLSDTGIKQAGIVTSFPLSDQWQAVARYYRDINNNQPVDTYLGIQYESCCWALRLVYERQLKTNFVNAGGEANASRLDSSIKLLFEIKGLSTPDTLGTQTMLESGLLKYGRPFYLNN